MKTHKTNKLFQTLGNAMKVVLITAMMVVAMMMYVSSIANAATLRSEIKLEKSNLTLGDVFEGIDDLSSANYVLGPAPRVGEDLILNAATLKKLSNAFNLGWTPRNNYEQAIIKRATTVIETSQIEAAIKEAVRDEAPSGNHVFAINDLHKDIILIGTHEDSVRVLDINFNRKDNSFAAKIAAPAKGPILKSMVIRGDIEYLVKVPTLIKRIKHDEIITKSDIRYIELPEKRLAADMLLDAKQLIGMTPRRILIEGRPVYESEVETPQIVKRGERVTMIFKSGGINLTTVGKALQDGAQGDNIRVVNMKSNRTIDALITRNGEVTVYN